MTMHASGTPPSCSGDPCATSCAAPTRSSRPRSCRSGSCCCSSSCSAVRSTRGPSRTSGTCCPGVLLITIATGISYTAFRLFLDLRSGIFERFRSMPIARGAVLWAHVLTSLVANLVSLVVVVAVALLVGFRSRRLRRGLARRRGHPAAGDARAHLAGGHPRADGEVAGRCQRVLLPADPAAVHQLRVRADRRPCPARSERSRSTSRSTSIVNAIRDLLAERPVGADLGVALAWCVGILVAAYAGRDDRPPPQDRVAGAQAERPWMDR